MVGLFLFQQKIGFSEHAWWDSLIPTILCPRLGIATDTNHIKTYFSSGWKLQGKSCNATKGQ